MEIRRQEQQGREDRPASMQRTCDIAPANLGMCDTPVTSSWRCGVDEYLELLRNCVLEL